MSKYFYFSLSVSFRQCSVFTHLTPMDIDSAVKYNALKHIGMGIHTGLTDVTSQKFLFANVTN
jgi:hypothetical protein